MSFCALHGKKVHSHSAENKADFACGEAGVLTVPYCADMGHVTVASVLPLLVNTTQCV